MAAVPVRGLVVFALGCCSVLWCAAGTASHRFFVTRMREKTAYRTVRGRSRGPASRAESIHVGQYRSPPCRHPLRMVSVLWQGTWYRSLPNGLDPQVVSARQVCALSRRRGRLAEAFARTKRVLDLASLWTGSAHAIPLPISATLIVSAVLLTLGQQVAQVLGAPVERSSVERVWRALYHDSQARQRGACEALGPFLVAHAPLLGVVKRWRKSHRERQPLEYLIWGEP
jgi:hypothetical protein